MFMFGFAKHYEKHTERVVELLLRTGAALRGSRDGFINMAQCTQYIHREVFPPSWSAPCTVHSVHCTLSQYTNATRRCCTQNSKMQKWSRSIEKDMVACTKIKGGKDIQNRSVQRHIFCALKAWSAWRYYSVNQLYTIILIIHNGIFFLARLEALHSTLGSFLE